MQPASDQAAPREELELSQPASLETQDSALGIQQVPPGQAGQGQDVSAQVLLVREEEPKQDEDELSGATVPKGIQLNQSKFVAQKC